MPPAPVTDVLSSASAAAYDRLACHAVRDDPGWLTVSSLLAHPEQLLGLAETAGRDRFLSDDLALVLAQVAREAITALTSVAVYTWSYQRRLLDLTAANVAWRDHEPPFFGVRRPALAVLAGDPLAGEPGVETIDETTMFDRLVWQTLGRPLPLDAVPSGPPERVAAVTAVIAAVRSLVRCGDRHLWGSVALAVASTLTRVSHRSGERAHRDREAVLTARPDLARTIELVTTPSDGDGHDPLTFALRRTCCLLYKLPEGAQCATCSLLDHDCRVASLTEWHRAERQRVRESSANDEAKRTLGVR